MRDGSPRRPARRSGRNRLSRKGQAQRLGSMRYANDANAQHGNGWRKGVRAVCAGAWSALNPPTFVAVLSVPAIALLLTWVFAFGNEGHPLACIAYVASAYLLAVLCIAIAKGSPVKRAKSFAERSATAKRLMEDRSYRQRSSAKMSLAIDALWAVANLTAGVLEASVWLITLGVYYMLLSLMRGVVMSRMRSSLMQGDAVAMRVCGIAMIASALALSGIVTLTMKGQGGFSYDGYFIYAVAAFAFYSLTIAVVNYVRSRNASTEMERMLARINLSVALVSMFALEAAMFVEFGTAQDSDARFILSVLTGAVVAAALVFMGAVSIKESGKERA